MDLLPSNIMFHIFSRVPIKCLARSRCVSKLWCNYINDRYLVYLHDKRLVEEPTPILYHRHLYREKSTDSLCFQVMESKQAKASHSYVLEAKQGPFLEFLPKKPLRERSVVSIFVEGTCNGLIFLSQDEDARVTMLFVVHPLRKECYQLPPLPMPFARTLCRGSYGFGFDASTNTLKVLCMNDYRTIVHVFGTNSWREIQVPYYLKIGKAIYANGYLHWLGSHSNIKTEDGGGPVIWFDLEKEEFGLIDPPKRMCGLRREYDCFDDHLVDLNGEAGYVYACTRTMEVWILKNKEWVLHCRFEKKAIPYNCYIKVIGCWNRNGDMLIKSTRKRNLMYEFLVYNLKSGVLHKTNIAGMNDGLSPDIFMYPNTMSSFHCRFNTNSSMRKTITKKSCCQRDLSVYAPWY